MDEDEVLAKITRLLEKGCTMLASHHDCGAPLFRYQGEIVCPVCSFKEEPLSALGVQATDSDREEGDGAQSSSRAQSPQMQKMSPGSGLEKYQPGRTLEEDRLDRPIGRIQLDKSVRRGQSGQSMDAVPSDRPVETDQPDQSMNMVPSDRPVEKGQPDQSMYAVPSDRLMEKDQPNQFTNKSPPNQPIQDDALLSSVRDDLRSVLLLRLQELTASLRAEQDLDKLERLLNCLEALLRVLRSLQE